MAGRQGGRLGSSSPPRGGGSRVGQNVPRAQSPRPQPPAWRKRAATWSLLCAWERAGPLKATDTAGEAWTGAQGGARPEELLACSAPSGAQLCAEEAGKVWAVRGGDGGPADPGIPGPPFLYCSELWEMTILLSAKLDIIPCPSIVLE